MPPPSSNTLVCSPPSRIQSLHPFINNKMSKRPTEGISDSRPTLWAGHCVAAPCLLWIHSALGSPGASSALPTKITKLSPNTANAPRGKATQVRTCAHKRAAHLHITDTHACTGGGEERKELPSTRFLPEKLSGLRFSSSDVMSDFFGEIPFLF